MNTSAKARHSWKEISQQRLFFDSLGETMGFSSLEDYYSLTKSDIVKAGGLYRGQIIFLSLAFPKIIPKFVSKRFDRVRTFAALLSTIRGIGSGDYLSRASVAKMEVQENSPPSLGRRSPGTLLRIGGWRGSLDLQVGRLVLYYQRRNSNAWWRGIAPARRLSGCHPPQSVRVFRCIPSDLFF